MARGRRKRQQRRSMGAKFFITVPKRKHARAQLGGFVVSPAIRKKRRRGKRRRRK